MRRLRSAAEPWNPYYVAYAKAHGHTPQAMRQVDRARWPGGINAGFLVWMSERYAQWRKDRGRPPWFADVMSDACRADFGTWLAEYAETACREATSWGIWGG